MRVVILMSTFNGERFVEEQLRSILIQLPPDGRVIVRDDGSTDQTVSRIQALCDPRVSIIRGENIGFARSFLALMAMAPLDADMYMLSDQDDVWLPVKVQRAWDHIKEHAHRPTLYCSRLKLVDVNLQPIHLSINWQRPPSFHNALTENIVTGCTAAFNGPALNLVRIAGDASLIFFHDWWLYLVVSAFGDVVFDREPTILYRQHGQNVIGMGAGIQRYWAILRFLRKVNWIHIMFNQIDNFVLTHGARLDGAQHRFISRFFHPSHPASILRLLLVPQRLRQSMLGELLFRGLLVANLLAGGVRPKRQIPPSVR
jgi:glycosyltransferase involved in cell wall biosynthesis